MLIYLSIYLSSLCISGQQPSADSAAFDSVGIRALSLTAAVLPGFFSCAPS
jgi:hypothetical protein